MKRIFGVVMLVLLCSCQPKSVQGDGGILMEIEVGDTLSSREDIAKTIEILKKRVEAICAATPVFNVSGNKVHIEMPLMTDTLVYTSFLIQKGEFEISRTYNGQEVLEYLSAINKSLVENNNYGFSFPNDTTMIKGNPLFNLISIQQTERDGRLQKGPVVGLVSFKDTALLNAVFRHPQLSMLMPRDLKFKWGRERKCIDQVIFKLIATKTQINGKMISNEMIEDATMYNRNGTFQINITFKPEFHRLWKRITSENIGASLAIIIDNEVVSSPMVQNEIPNGKSSIFANYTAEEAKALAALLKNGILPLKVKVNKISLVRGD